MGRSLRHRRLLLARDAVYDWNASVQPFSHFQLSRVLSRAFHRHRCLKTCKDFGSTSLQSISLLGFLPRTRERSVPQSTTGVGTTVCVLCNVSHLFPHLPLHLTVAPDLWNKQGRPSSSVEFWKFGSHGWGFPGYETTGCCNPHVRGHVGLRGVRVYRIPFIGGVSSEGHLETKGDPCSPTAVL